MAKRDSKGNPITGKGEHFTKLIRATMETPAWRALPPIAQALYPWLRLEWRGPDANNNGKLRLSVRQAAIRMGVSRDTAARAFHELQAKGFIVMTERACLGIEGAAKSPAFEITELPLPHGGGREGRKLFKDWRPGQDFPVMRAGANNPEGRNGKAKPCHENQDGTVINIMTKGKGAS
ncbi:helix-turn-helix domain-containing protein [Nioella ostreopsis]|uniref:helix-turn-helix domain-containing protein n=1 Tax=Nioella ostreopsis TaxID=2448479 RepID=UPI000FDB7AE2|nr:helix-turn-helix domain-containing protein [Nioella ostreopsis]